MDTVELRDQIPRPVKPMEDGGERRKTVRVALKWTSPAAAMIY